MVEFDKDRFLKDLLALNLSTPTSTTLSGSTGNFAQYMAASSLGPVPKTTARNLGLASQAEKDARGVLPKTFSWLMSLGNMAENVFMDASDPNQNLGEQIKNAGIDVAAGVGNFLNPIQELVTGGGLIQTPWEDKVGQWLREHNTEYRGEPISGQKILQDRFGMEGKGLEGVARSGLGFGIDVLTDPLTYASGGVSALAKIKGASKALEEAAATSKTVESAHEAVKAGTEGAANSMFGTPTPLSLKSLSFGATPEATKGVKTAAETKMPASSMPSNLSETWVPSHDINQAQKVLDQSLSRRIESAQPLSPQVLGPYVRDYEKLVKVPKEHFEAPAETGIGNLIHTERANIAKSEGEAFADEVLVGAAPKDLSRSEQANLFQDLTSRAGTADMTQAELKHTFRAVENRLADNGFTFSDGRLSEFMHAKNVASKMRVHSVDPNDLSHFTEGVTRKTAFDSFITDPATYKRVMSEQFARKGGQVLGKHGINPLVVEDARKAIEANLTPIAARTPVAASGLHRSVAIREAEKFAGKLGKPIGTSGQVRHAELNPANQANLWNALFEATAHLPEINSKFKGLHSSTAALKWRNERTLEMLRTAEDHLISSRGLRGQHWGGTGLRLSEVLSELGPDMLKDYIPRVLDAFTTKSFSKVTPDVRSLIEKSIARRTTVTGAVAKHIYDDVARQATVTQQAFSPKRYADWLSGEAELARQKALKMGLTDKEANAVKELVQEHTTKLDLENLDPFQVVDTIGVKMARQLLEKGTPDPKMIRQISKSITRQMGKKPGQISADLLQNDVRTWLDHSLTTWRGRGFMMPKKNDMTGAYQYWSKARADHYGRLFEQYTTDEHYLGFAFSQKPLEELMQIAEGLDPRIQQLAKIYSEYFDNILATPSKVRLGDRFETRAADPLKGSMAVRAQLRMEDINKNLASLNSDFRLKAGKDGNWLDSYKNADPKKLKQHPAAFMYTMDQAIQKTVAEYNLVDMLAAEFGKAPGEAGFKLGEHTHNIHHHRIPSDVKFDQQVAKEFHTLLRDMEQGQWVPGSKFTKFLTDAQKRWKSSVTIYYPAHHEHNFIGDTALMWLAGHNDPRVFLKAQKVLGSQRSRYKAAIKDPDISALNKMMDPNAENWVNTASDAIISSKYGSNIRAYEYVGEMVHRGLLKDASQIEDLFGNTIRAAQGPRTALDRILRPFGGKVHDAASTVSEVREHLIRLAHFISYTEKHMTRDLASKLAKAEGPTQRSEIMSKFYDGAAQEIRKYHPDGSDLTYFEQKYLRWPFPFYAWLRKAIPLTIEGMILRPSKITAWPRANFAAQGMLGIDSPGPSDQYPSDQLFPDWTLATGIGPLGASESLNPVAHWFGQLGRNQITWRGEEKGYTEIDPGTKSLPTGIISDMLGLGRPTDVAKGVEGSLTPFLSIPMDLFKNRTQTEVPIYGDDKYAIGTGNYLASKVPQLEIFQRLFGLGKDTKSWQEGYDTGWTEPWLNLFTGLGFQGTGRYTKTAQLQLQDRLKAGRGG